jgi:hypothetical protein
MTTASKIKYQRLNAIQRHILRLQTVSERLERQNERFTWYRLGALIAGALFSYLAFSTGSLYFGWSMLLVSVAAFVVVVYFHRRLDESRLRFQHSLDWFRAQSARMTLHWESMPPAAFASVDVEDREAYPTGHPYAIDLNLVGERSIHQLLDTAVSRGGSRRLLDWLLAPIPDPEKIADRQAVLAEMIPLSGFRNRLALNSAWVSQENQRWDGERLLNWLEIRTGGKSLRAIVTALVILSAVNLILFVLYVLGTLPPYWLASFGAYGLLYASRYADLEEVFGEATHISSRLERFRAVLVYLESYPYKAGSRLAKLCRPFWEPQQKSSAFLRSIVQIASAASLQNNFILGMFLNALVPWDIYFAYRLEQFKDRLRRQLPQWLETWYELEALNSLANFAYLNPDYSFPEILSVQSQAEKPVFIAENLGHPLLPDEEKISNDFTLQRLGQVALISGSNMSGKSTFLRTLGVNLCLAYAGGPVDASALQVIPFRVFTCINISDSLSYGISYFYAEVRRLKALLNQLDQPHPFPVFFLIDEIFRGTNNREREIGSRSFVRRLVDGYGAGAISTHDLELVHLADDIDRILNYHFREDVQDSRMHFDYRLRTGPSPTTNALKIMQMEGLPVDPQDAPAGGAPD